MHDVHGFILDRIQTGGVSNLNIPVERIYELGNYETVATIRDIPDLSFEVASLDVFPETEGVIVSKDATAASAGEVFDFTTAIPIDVISPFKSRKGAFDIVKGVVVPSLTLDQVTYRFGLRANAEQTFTFRGDSIYYIPGTPYCEEFTKGAGPFVYTTANTMLAFTERGITRHALSVCAFNPATGAYKRLFKGTGAGTFTDTTTNVTVNADPGADYTDIRITYGSATSATYNQTVHEDVSIKPAAVRGKDIDIYVGAEGATPGSLFRWTGVQSFEANRRVNLDNDEEFGNYHYVSTDYDVAEVNGNVVLRPQDLTDLFAKLHQISDTTAPEVIGPNTSIPLAMEARISDPDGNVVKTLYVPDARFTLPSIQGRVQQKIEVTIPFESDSGSLKIYKGARP